MERPHITLYLERTRMSKKGVPKKRKKRRGKYRVCAVEDRTWDKEGKWEGPIVFDSRKEMNRYEELIYMVDTGEIHCLERQPKFPWKTVYSHGDRTYEKNNYYYRADFQYVICATGDVVVEDVKGFRTPEYKRKKRIVEHLYEITITEV